MYMDKGQHILFNPSQMDLSVRELMRDAGGDGATIRMAQRKLDNLGYIKAHSGLANDDRRMKRLQNAAELAASMAEIAVVQATAEKNKKTTERHDLLKLVPDAIVKFNEKGRDVSKLTKNEITALLMGCYGIDVGAAGKKEKKLYFTKKLQEEIASDGTKIPAAAAATAAPNAATAAPNAATAAPNAVIEAVHPAMEARVLANG